MSMSQRLLRPKQTGFTPASLGSLLSAWFDADDAGSITLNGSSVSQWNDKSGNARNLSQGTAANQPAYETNKVNSRPAILFDGSNDILANAAAGAAGVTNASVFMVMKYVSASGDDVAICIGSQTNPVAGTGIIRAFFRATGGTTQGFGSWGNDQTTSAYSTDIGGSYHLFAFRQNGSALQIRRDGAGTNYTLGSTPAAVAYNDLTIGSIGGAYQSTYYSNISVAEVVVLYSYASDANTSSIEKYLSAKWGIALA